MSIRATAAAAALFLVCLAVGCGDKQDPTPPPAQGDAHEDAALALEAAVHLPTPDGTLAAVAPGAYTVSRAAQGLRLVSADGTAVVVSGTAAAHDETLPFPIAIDVPGASEDTHFVMLFLPDGTRIDAFGTYTGERTRGLFKKPPLPRVRAKVKAAVTKAKAVVAKTLVKFEGHAAMLAAWKRDKGRFLRDLMGEATATVSARYDATIGALGKDVLPGRTGAGGAQPSIDTIVRRALAMVHVLAKDRPALKALLDSGPVQAYLGGTNPPIVKDCMLLIELCRKEARATFEKKIQPKLVETATATFKKAAASALTAALTSGDEDSILLTEDELQAVVSGLFTKYIVAQCNQGAARLDALGSAEGEDRAKALAAAEHALARERRWEGPRAELYAGILRAMTHKFIDSRKPWHGGYCLDRAFGMLQMSEGTVEKLATAIAGLIPEVGAACCAVLELAIDAAWNMVLVPALQREATEQIHDLADAAVDEVAAAMKAQRRLALASIRRPGVRAFATSLYELSTDAVVEKHLQDLLAEIDTALETYNQSVLRMARSAGD